MIEHLETVIFPFAKSKKTELGLAENQKCMLIFDVFKGQGTQKVLNLLDENGCVSIFVPPNLTHMFQPLDLSINGVAKSFLKSKFQSNFQSYERRKKHIRY